MLPRLATSPLRGAASAASLLGRPSVRFYGRGDLPVNIGVRVVPQQSAWVVERFGKFHTILEPGIHFLIPFVDRIAYVHSLKETAVNVPNQTAITRDNVTIQIDGVLFLKVVDPQAASYGVEDAFHAVTQLAQTTMRSELGKLTLDKTFEERESLNMNIVEAINQAAKAWGISCLRYEIRDITPPVSVKAAMDSQAEAERRKRAEILESEGLREAAINTSEGKRQGIVLQARGESEAIIARATATAEGILRTAKAIRSPGGLDAVSLRIAEQYINAFGRLAQKGNTVLLPANVGDPSAMVAQALSVFDSIRRSEGQRSASAAAVEVEEDSLPTNTEQSFGDAGDSVSAAVPPTTDTFVPQPWGSESHKP